MDEHGNVDYRSKTNMQVVHEGDILAEAFPATTGTAGMTVMGTEVPPVDGKVPSLSGGFNTTLSEDRMQLKASMDGHLQYKNGVFHVQPLFHVLGNVDFGIGNIDFPGDVHITGDVQNGFIVQAKGNITVDGLVEGAVLEAGGSIVVRKGVLGDGRAVIRAQQSVTAQFLENCVVYAGDSVMSSSIITSAVHSDNEIVVRSGRGIVIGGKLTATNLISATVIGSRSERLTELTIGDLPFIKQQREELLVNLQEAEKEEQALERNIQYLDIGDAVEEDTQRAMNRAQLLAKQRLQKNIVTLKKERYLKQLRELDQKRIDLDDCRIISDMIYPVTKVQIGELKTTIENLSLNCTVRVSPLSDEIVIES